MPMPARSATSSRRSPEVGYAAHIFVGSKAPWVELKDGAPKFEEGFGSKRVG